jgi:hypothetical protein
MDGRRWRVGAVALVLCGCGDNLTSLRISVAAETIEVRGTADVEVTVHREYGYDGPVHVSVSNPPDGLSGSVVVEPGQRVGVLTLESDQDPLAYQGRAFVELQAIAGDGSDHSDSAKLELFIAGPPGTRDLTFNGGRGSFFPANQVEAQGDQILIASGGRIVRLEAGRPDPSFGAEGSVLLEAPGYLGLLAVHDDDTIYLSAHIAGGIDSVGRLDSNGGLDTSFGASGFVAFPLEAQIRVLEPSDSGVFVGGVQFEYAEEATTILVSLDHQGDERAPPTVLENTLVRAARADERGLWLVGLRGYVPYVGGGDLWIGRFLPEGTIDTKFGAGTGEVVIPAVLVPSGRGIIPCGVLATGNGATVIGHSSLLVTVELDDSGALVGDGIRGREIELSSRYGCGVAVGREGHLYVTGTAHGDIGAWRLHEDFTPDGSFAHRSDERWRVPGWTAFPEIGFGHNRIYDAAVDSRNGLIGASDYGVYRFWP